MKIKDRPEYKSKPRPLTCAAGSPVADAVARMAELNYGSIVVLDDDESVAGIVTERDLVKRVLNEGRDPAQTHVGAVMTTNVRVASENDELIDWLRIMSNERFRRLPIVDNDGKLISIMTQGDFVSYTWPDLVSQAVTLTRSTLSGGYQIALIVGAVLAYTAAIVAVTGAT